MRRRKKRQTNEQKLSSLMQAAQAGDADAYVQLLEETTLLLRRIIRRRRPFLAIEDVDDLVQDILLSVHSVRATYDPARPFMPWLLAITRNRLADAARRYLRQRSPEVPVENLAVTFSSGNANSTIRFSGALEQGHEGPSRNQFRSQNFN